ncbi:MAG TPA: cobalamin-binding protein [Candidatus Baltobacteraceae bacterium]|nr:cobalamin-binding protein [Candidatus Baltobacteraceae bacterium]
MRIVSLLPSATEILFDIGAGPQVVGVTHECDYPDAARALPHLTSSALPNAANSAEIDRHVRRSLHEGSSLYHLDADLLASLAPDLIVTQELCAVCAVSYEIVDRATKRLRHDHRLMSLEPSSLEDVLGHIELLGDVTLHRAQASAVAASLRARIARLSHAPRLSPPPRVLVLEWTDPPMSGGHWTPGLVELAGAIPLLGNPGANSRVLAWDEIAAADPDAIVVGPCGFDLEKTHAAIAELDANDGWRALRAVRDGRVHAIDGNAYLNRPGPRLVDTAEIIETVLRGPARTAT